MLEKYYRYKFEYNGYLILLKCGSFYECIDNDAFIMNLIFNYKLRKLSNTFKVGFPVSSLNLVLAKLNKCHINYIIVDKEVSSTFFDDNKYFSYDFNDKEVFYNSFRINKIISYLNDNLLKDDINQKLKLIEDIIFD